MLSAAAIAVTALPASMPTAFAEVQTLEVGVGKTYATISEAVAAAKALDPQSEDERVTINVDPGDYEEQVMIEDVSFITLQQTPDTSGKVDLYWYYCTGYCAGNTGLDGRYDPKINWSKPETWTGYNDGDEQFTAYRLGQQLTGVSTISYYDTDGVAHKDVPVKVGHLGDFADQAALVIDNKSTDITVKDFNIVNAVPVMVTAGEKEVGLAPQEDRNVDHATSYILPRRDNLTICDEDTVPEETERLKTIFAIENDTEKVRALEALENLTPGESAYLVRSDKYNERGHAIAIDGDRIILEGIRARGNQDSVWVGEGRQYFKNCDLIGGTDYIYGDATVVFDNCLLGAAGMTNKDYGATITAANHDANNPYGYLFYNCTVYNVLDNITTSLYGRPWRPAAQITFYKTKLDDNAQIGESAAGISDPGWRDMSGNMADEARFYEYGTYNASSGKAVDLSNRLENADGFGTVLDDWQILEYNPRNYFNSDFWLETKGKSEWDPMNFGEEELSVVDDEMKKAEITVPAGEETTIALPSPSSSDIEFRWESASANAVVSADGKSIEVIRPAAGEAAIETTVVLYAKDKNTGFGDKKEIPVTINPTTDTVNVFNMPVTISQSAAAENNYTVTVTKNGALIKQQVIAVDGNEAADTIANIPASASGIEYDVAIVSESNDFTITVPDGGKTKVTGKVGENVPLNITAQKLIDETITLDIATSASDGNRTYDLIALANAKGASGIENSDIITVTLDIDVDSKPAAAGFIDISSGTPSNANSATPQRFTVFKINNSWEQIDAVNHTQSFSGSKPGIGQCLNLTGKFTDKGYPSENTVSAVIDYKAGTVTVKGSKIGSYTFEGFPEGAEKGTLNMGVFPGNSADAWNVNTVEVTYKKLVTSGEDPNPPEQEKVPDTVTLDLSMSASGGDNTYDIMDLAEKAGAKGIKDSETVKVEFDVDVDQKPSADSFIDFSSGTPSKANEAVAQRFTLFKINSSWEQIDTVNHTQSFSGTDNGAGQCLNLSGKFDAYDKIHTVGIEIDFTNKTVTVDGSDSGSYKNQDTPHTFEGFPSGAEKGTLNIGVFPGSADDVWTISNVRVTYMKPVETPPIDTTKRIVSAYRSGGNTEVTLENIDSGVVIGAVYDDNGVLQTMKCADADGDEVTLEGIEADKVFVWESLDTMIPVCDGVNAEDAPENTPGGDVSEVITADFSAMDAVPVYSEASGRGFVEVSGAYAASGYERKVAPVSSIELKDGAAAVTESSGSYLRGDKDWFEENDDDGTNRNHGGLIYRADTAGAGAYRIEVEVADAASVYIAPTGMDASRLTSTSNWDNAGEVPRSVSAKWSGNVWTYDFATGEDFIEIEIEPKTLPTADAPQTVAVKSITITPLEVNAAGDKPTIHILGDSTQKTYTFNETISGWGQTLGNYFDSSKVNVINYSMGGRAMKSSYNEGRFNEVLISGKQGDYVFIHSAHNDETTSLNRFSRGAGLYKDNLEANNANYQKWLDMYVDAIKARGMTPVLVTGMPRTSSGGYSESALKPNGFNPDSPQLMRDKAASDPEVGLAELYEGAKDYIDSLDSAEVRYIYNTYEAGETPAENAANGTNGDGTHYREAAAKQWSRIILQSIYDQANASDDKYTDKAIMQELTELMPQAVVTAAQSGDWSAVFPEMAEDVSAVGVVPDAQKQSADKYYYRNNIEKALELGLLHKNSENLFKPGETITVGEFARGAEKAFGLAENSLTNYTKTYAELTGGAADSASEQSIELMSEDEVTITVTQPEGGTVAVYNDSAFSSFTADITKDIQANAVVSDNDYFTLTAPANIETKSDSSAQFADNSEVTTAGIITRNQDSKETVITAKADGKMTAYVRGRADRYFAIKDTDGGAEVTKTVNDDPIIDGDSSNVYGTVVFDVTAGSTYQFYAKSFGGILFGLKYESNDYPQSTESLAVNKGDTVRVTAVADAYYINGSIIVNGSLVDASREYSFTAEGDTTVTASFTAEPVLVDSAQVASDAALTREVMAAILYDAYNAVTDETVKANMAKYMAQNGSVPSPDDPNYDPNIQYEGTPYTPLTGWGVLTDTEKVNETLYQKVKTAYNLGLIRTETGIARGTIANGTELEPTEKVTRAKAAKSLVFAFILTQPQGSANQKLPDGVNHASETAEIAVPNASAPSVPVV